jgi:hypothetical protein
MFWHFTYREYLNGFNPNLHYNSMDDDEFNQRLESDTKTQKKWMLCVKHW